MPAYVTEIEPPRGRVGDTVTIRGGGFDAGAPGNNTVTFLGITATATSSTTTEIVCTVPNLLGLAKGEIISVAVTNNATGDEAPTHYWHQLLDIGDLAAQVLADQEPGPEESALTGSATVAEAKDYQRLVTYAEFVNRDLLSAKGDLLARDTTGLAVLAAGAEGSELRADAAAATGLAWVSAGGRATLVGGVEAPASAGTVRYLVPNQRAYDPTQTADTWVVPSAATVDYVWVYHQAGSAGPTLDRVEVLRNGVVQHDSGAGLGVAYQQLYSATVAISVAAGDRLQLRGTTAGGSATQPWIGGLLLALA